MPQLTLAIIPEVSPRPTAFLTDSATVISARSRVVEGEEWRESGLDVKVLSVWARFAMFLCSRWSCDSIMKRSRGKHAWGLVPHNAAILSL